MNQTEITTGNLMVIDDSPIGDKSVINLYPDSRLDGLKLL